MKAKTLTFTLLAAFSIILLTSFASATVDFVGVTGDSQTVDHNSLATVSFYVQATTFGGQFDNASIVLPNIFGSSTSWSGLNNNFTLLPDSNSTLKTFTVTVPQYQTPGVYGGSIDFIGTYNDTGPIVKTPLPFTITVNSNPSLSITKTQELSETQNGKITIENTGNTDLTLTLTDSGAFDVTLNPNIVPIAKGDVLSEITVMAGLLDDLSFGDNTVTITATDAGSSITATTTFTIKKTFCSAGAVGTENLTIRDVKINSDGNDDDVWNPLDEITIEVEVKNQGDDSIQDVFVELALFDSNGENVIGDFEFDDSDEESVDLGRVRDGDRETATFVFIVPADFEEDTYSLAVKVYSDDLGEDNMCDDTDSDLSDSYFQEIDVEVDEDNPVFVDNIELSSEVAACGDKLTVTFEVYNTGEDEDQVRVNIFNSILGLDLKEELRSGLDQGDGEKLELTFTIPEGTESDIYNLIFSTEFDYDSDDDVYDESSEDIWVKSFEVFGCGSVSEGGNVSIDATLDSDEAKAGEEIVITTTITNEGDTTKTYIIDGKDFEDWAELVEISDRVFSIAPGESKEVTFTFNVENDAVGEQSFVVEVTSGDELDSREVTVTIEEASSIFGGSSMIWIIGAINVVLIILIIIVAASISKR